MNKNYQRGRFPNNNWDFSNDSDEVNDIIEMNQNDSSDYGINNSFLE